MEARLTFESRYRYLPVMTQVETPPAHENEGGFSRMAKAGKIDPSFFEKYMRSRYAHCRTLKEPGLGAQPQPHPA
jgi:hypothetical protein